MVESVDFMLKISIFQNLLLICISLITVVAAINLCAKKRMSEKGAARSANATSIKATPSSKKSIKHVSNSPGAPTTPTCQKKSPDENGNYTDKVAVNEKGSVVKRSGEKSKEGGATKKTAGETEDSFESHKPVAREAKRAEEIKKNGPVDQKRKDYKTIRNDILSSDFDKSLGLPELEDKKK